MTTEKREAVSGMGGRNAGEEMEVVVDSERINRLAGNENEPGPRKTKKHEHAKHALLVVMGPCDLVQHVGVERQTWDDNDAAFAGRIRKDVSKLDKKLLLKELKLTTLFT